MTTANLTGTKPRNISLDIVTLPSQMVNIEDLAGTVVADTGNYTFTRETGAEGLFRSRFLRVVQNLKRLRFHSY